MKYLMMLLALFILSSCAIGEYVPTNKSWQGVVIRDSTDVYKFSWSGYFVAIVKVVNDKGILDKKVYFDAGYGSVSGAEEYPVGTWIKADYSKIYEKFTYKKWKTNIIENDIVSVITQYQTIPTEVMRIYVDYTNGTINLQKKW